MSDKRRKKYYTRCQEIIDDIHERVAKGEFLTDQHCINLYGRADYRALQHELRMMNALADWSNMTPAMEWLYLSRHFTHKANEESAINGQRKIARYSMVAAICSAVCSIVLCCKGCSDADHSKAYEEDACHNEKEVEYSGANVGEMTPSNEALNIIQQVPDALNNLECEEKDAASDGGRDDKSK